MGAGDLADGLGKGVVAGALGTAAMTPACPALQCARLADAVRLPTNDDRVP